MNFATGLNVVRGWNIRKLGLGFLTVAMLGAGTLFSGGCANQKDEQIASLNAEVAQLKEEKAQAEQARAAEAARANEMQANKQNQEIGYQNPNDNPGKTPGRPSHPPEKDVIITVAGDVLFNSGQATLKPDAKKELDKVASQLKGQYGGHQIRVEGYTDSDPIKKAKFPSNEALSQARAEAVEKYLITKGISSNRISAVGMGAAKPKSTKPASRRVEIVVMGQ